MESVKQSNNKLWLGFDLSTQQLKSVAINEELIVVHEACVHFDKDLPEFRTNGGIYSNPDDHTAFAPVLMWIKAIDLIFDRLRLNGLVDFKQVIGVSGCGQQHGSVYWKHGSEKILMNLNSSRFLHEQLNHCFTIQESPIWMDSSTTVECEELEKALGGAHHLAQLTGSRAYERFTGNQISKIIKQRTDAYNQTERISLVSSFLASLFIGKYAPIDLSDGSGMNLLDIRRKQWSNDCVRSVSLNQEKDLIKKLGDEIVPSIQIIGTISDYFVQRYDFIPDCYITAFTGDNSASLAGMCLGSNDIAVSLGTSDTIFFTLSTPQPSIEGHILCNPIDQNLYMGMIVFKNGSRTRERIRDNCANGNWSKFNELLDSVPRGNFGNLGFYFDFQEISPMITGDFRYSCFGNEVFSFAPEIEIRACIEGQFLRLKIHAENLGFKLDNRTRILATGGASTNLSIIKVLADVFNAPVFTHSIPNSGALGSALLARYSQEKNNMSYDDMVKKLRTTFNMAAKPSSDACKIYSALAMKYRQLEDRLTKLK
ncbi:xylulose kinase [Dermatophagoides pteronyssinus]|uniref:Uncharacterized protein n=2 Tax=Dermatophagoides pteronyssinus TaxID=6956 RepID=A0ABQ8JE37_DERPT|nr:xylulose kinase-like [Dermatophagoides pteronyssinus]KAH9420869.1 hypothetical protein DERP_001303 [Dermatophagoides pteronyssinus]